MKLSKALLLISLSLLLFCTGWGSVQSAQHPTALQVTRLDNRGHTGLRVWMITDAHAVQQLFDEIQRLPGHQPDGTDACWRPHYTYSLEFLAGAKSLQKDELYARCVTLTFADGSAHDTTATFDSRFAGILHL